MGKEKNTRMCIVCRKEQPRGRMVRIVRTPDGIVGIDGTGKADGRGAYICRTKECVEAAVKKRAVNRAFRQEINGGVYDALKAMAGNDKQESM